MENEKWKGMLFILALLLVIIGALYWGWIGITKQGLGTGPRVIYVIIGLAGLYVLIVTAMNYGK
jgi:uncharacterized membrane protein YuzA (DUF378 family)